MSVINQMLKDLERRQGGGRAGSEWMQNLQLKPDTHDDNRDKYYYLWWLLPAIILIALLQYSRAPMNEIPLEKIDSGVALVPETPEVLPQAVQSEIPKKDLVPIEAIQLYEETQRFQIELRAARLLTVPMQQESAVGSIVRYRIASARLQTTAPVESVNNRYLKHLALFEDGEDVLLELKLQRDMLLSHYSNYAGQGGHRLMIDIKPKPVEKTAEIAAPVEVKETEWVPVEALRKPVIQTVNPEALYRDAQRQLQAGRQKAAQVQLEKLVNLVPEHRAANQVLAELLLRNGRYAEAAAVLRNALQHIPGDSRLSLLYGRLLTESGDYVQADQVLDKVSSQTGNAEFMALRAAVVQRLGRHQQAVDYYLEALELRNTEAVWWMGIGISLEALKKNTQARHAYRSARANGLPSRELLEYVESRLRDLKV